MKMRHENMFAAPAQAAGAAYMEKNMKHKKQNIVFFIAAFITGVFFFTACNNNVNDAGSEQPAQKRKASKLFVTNRVDLVQKWSASISNPDLGGWYEKTDAPQMDSSVDYETIDPKKTILVIKYFGSDETEEEADISEYTVVVLDAEDKPLESTKLDSLGTAKIKIVYKADNEVPVSYLGMDGKPLSGGKDYFEVMVADTSPPEQQTFAGLTVQRPPVKTVYDWKEPFDSSGLEVVKWYGGKSVAENGTPVIAVEEDYTLDYSAYSKITEPLPDGTEPAPLSSYPDFEIKVKPRESAESTDVSKIAAFTIKLEFKQYTLKVAGSGGQNLSGGAVNFNGVTQYKVKDNVKLTLIKTTNTTLNPESLSVHFAGQEVRPSRQGISKNQLNFFWDESSYKSDGTIDVDSDTLRASFDMPASDILVVADFVFTSTRLSNLEVNDSEQAAWAPLYGFSPNINKYEHILLNRQNEIFVRVSTQASATDFKIEPESEHQISNDGKILHIEKVGTGDTVVTITTSMESSPAENITYLTIKRFDADNRITYTYTGDVQTFIPPVAGNYKFTAWGAYGGNAIDYDAGGGNGRGGRAARAEGVLFMDPEAAAWIPNSSSSSQVDSPNLVYIYVGEGGYAREGFIAGKATYNGGGAGGMGGAYGAGSSGGGATSVSLSRGAWSDWQVLIDRILAAGGGGGYSHNNGRPGAAGGLIAQGGRIHSNDNLEVGDTNLSTGYSCTIVQNGYWSGATQRVGSGRGGQGFGIGGAGPSPPGYGTSGAEGRGGGGGGYFGGEIAWGKVGKHSNAGGGGGSSYVSGHPGVISYRSISSMAWLVPTGSNTPQEPIKFDEAVYHYSGRAFTQTNMTDIPETGLWQNDQGVDSPAPDPFNGSLGGLGQKNRDGILFIEYQQPTP